MADSGAKTGIQIKEDGVYLTVKRQAGEVLDRMGIRIMIENMGVQDIDFVALNLALSLDTEEIDAKISSNKELVKPMPQPEEMDIIISEDKMTAYAIFREPLNDGPKLSQEDIEYKIEISDIKFGGIESAGEHLAKSRSYDYKHAIANGMPFLAGKDGYLKYHFDTKDKTHKPKVMDDGRVDFKSLNLVEMTHAEKVLITAVPEEFGRDGMNVFGNIVPQPKLKPAPKLSGGKGTKLSQDGSQLLSAMDGQIVFDGKKVSVNPVLEIAGDVGTSTGNIDFVGSVIVKGNVISGFRVEADGDIDIEGVVEGAYVRSRHNVNIARGVQGLEKAEIIAEGDISLKFAENCKIRAGKNIFAEAVIHSIVRCGKKLELQGKNGYLVGGDVSAREAIIAKTIGSSMGTATNIQVGLDPSAFDEYNGYIREYNQLKNEYDKIINASKNMKQLHDNGELSEHKKNLFLRLLHQQSKLRQRMLLVKNSIDDLNALLSGTSGYVSVMDALRSGVKVIIGDATIHIREEIKGCVLRNIDGSIIIGNHKEA